MTKPIPGPYFIDEDRAAICTRCERTGEVLTLAMFTEWGESDRATARVMIASLDMLAAMKRLLASTDAGNAGQHDDGCRCVIHEACAAIAKAEGRVSPSLTAMRTDARRYRRALSGLAKS